MFCMDVLDFPKRVLVWNSPRSADELIGFLKYINTRDGISSRHPNSGNRVENTTRSGVFLTKFRGV